MTELSPDNKIINGLWISPDGKPLSNLERLCIYSFCANGHDFRLWTYGDLPNIPRDTVGGKVEVRDGNEVLSKDKIFTWCGGSLAIFADWFRWELMRKIGGWYMDMDMICLRPMEFADAFVFCKENWETINAAAMKFPRGHFFADALADACANPLRAVPWDTKKRRRRKMRRALQFWRNAHLLQGWGETGGPEGVSLAAKHFNLFKDAKPHWMTMFVYFAHSDLLFNEDLHNAGVLRPLMQNVFAMHFWHENLRKASIDKNGVFPPNSPFEILKRRYLPELQE